MTGITRTAPYPTAIVLGGGFFMDGSLTTLSRQRLNKAVTLFQQGRIAAITVLGERKSTYFKNALEFDVTGADKRADYLIGCGVPPDKINRIPYGRDTIGEALAVKAHNTFSSILLITSDLHIPRAHWIFETILRKGIQIDDCPVPCDGLLITEEEAAYLQVTQEYFSLHPDILADTDNWHEQHADLYVSFKSIHDLFHPQGKESEAYCAVKLS